MQDLITAGSSCATICAYLRTYVAEDANISLAQLQTWFELLTSIYRQCIESTRKSRDAEAGVTVVLEELRASAPTPSLVTELDMVDLVFEPVLAAKLATSTTCPISAKLTDALVLYFESLLRNQIYPHKKAQTFLFALCVSTKSFETLRQLLHYHVILDSNEILHMLLDLATVVAREPLKLWTTQMSLDMAWRLRDFDVLGLLLTEHSVDEPELFVHCLHKSKKLSQHWQLAKFLELLQTRLDQGSLTVRRMEAIVDAIVDLLKNDDVMPDLTGCHRWIHLPSPTS